MLFTLISYCGLGTKFSGVSAHFICKRFHPDRLLFACQKCVDCLGSYTDRVKEISYNCSIMLDGMSRCDG